MKTGTKIIKNHIDSEGIGIELFINNDGKAGVRIYDADVNENYNCKIFLSLEKAEKHYNSQIAT